MLQEDGYDPYRLPYWIRASFIMEERWGELEAEFNAGKEAMQLAEDWGVVSITPFLPCMPSCSDFHGKRQQACADVLCCMLPYQPGLAMALRGAVLGCSLRSCRPSWTPMRRSCLRASLICHLSLTQSMACSRVRCLGRQDIGKMQMRRATSFGTFCLRATMILQALKQPMKSERGF